MKRDMEYAVVYRSAGGNTRLLAEYLYRDLRTKNKAIRDLNEKRGVPEADVYLVCFGIRGESCGADVIRCLESLKGKKIALFATCGYSPIEAYRAKLERGLTVWLPEDAEYLGFFLCQGQVSPAQQEVMISEMPQWAEAMKGMFEEGEYRPGLEDLRAASAFLKRITDTLETG